MLNGQLTVPKKFNYAQYFNQDSAMGLGVYPDEALLFAYNVENCTNKDDFEMFEKITSDLKQQLRSQEVVQATPSENEFNENTQYQAQAQQRVHQQQLPAVFPDLNETVNEVDCSILDASAADISAGFEGIEADDSPTRNAPQSQPTSDPEVTHIDIPQSFKLQGFVKAAGQGHSRIPRSRDGSLFKRNGITIYNHEKRPSSSDATGIWMTTNKSPHFRSLHFAHAYMQKQPNLMAEPYAEFNSMK